MSAVSIPERMLKHPDLSAGAKLLYGYLLQHEFTSAAIIAPDLGTSSGAVAKWVIELKKAGEFLAKPGAVPVQVIEDSFEELWAAYPRRMDKHLGRTQYSALRRSGVEHSRLLAAVRFYAAARHGEDHKYTKKLATFLAPEGPWTEWEHGCPDGEQPFDGRTASIEGLRRFLEDGER